LIAAVRNGLQRKDRWLLIFDNAQTPTELRAYLPPTGAGHVLLTSRTRHWRGMAQPLELELLPAADVVTILVGSSPDPGLRSEAGQLAEELGYLALALAQARAYLDELAIDIPTYRQRLAGSRRRVLARLPEDTEYPHSVATVWQTSIEAAEGRCPAARPLLELLAFLGPDAVPRTLLDAAPKALPEGLQDPADRDEAIGALHRFFLLQADPGTLTVHRLVQAVTRDGLDEATAKVRAEAAVLSVAAALPYPTSEHTNWPAIGVLLPHMLAATESAERLEVGLKEAAWILEQTALYHHARAAWAEAEPLYVRAISLGEKAFGPEHPRLSVWLNNLARLYRVNGRPAEAELLIQRALAIDEAIGPRYPGFAASLNNLAVLYQETGRPAEAEPLIRRAVAIDEGSLSADHPEVADCLNGLARLYRETGRYAEAEPLMERALAIGEKVAGGENADFAQSLNNLAMLYQETGRYAEAEPLYQRALNIRERVLAPKHPNFAQSLNNLALLYQKTGRYAEAEPLYQRAVAITEKTLGPEHLGLGIALNNLALLYQETGRLAEAERVLKRALALIEKSLPAGHPHLMSGLENYAHLLDQLGYSTEASKDSTGGGLRSAATHLPFIDSFKGIGRNDPCPCGSGKKFKKCHLSHLYP
jgi:tetratricopeptide (TPR) repeat protein